VGLRVVIVGIPGVGKTTIVNRLVSETRGAKLVNFGTLMLEVAVSLKMVKNRDEIRRLPIGNQKRLQRAAARKIAGMKQSVVVVDTHLFIRTQEGFWPGLPYDVVRAMKPTHLVLVEATPEEIARRRSTDSTRYRDAVTLESLTEELALARSFLAVSSTLTGAPISIVRNPEGKQEEVTQGLAGMLEQATH
jgi:adenylate kinase